MDRMFIDVNIEEILKSDKGFQLQDGDKVQIFSVLDLAKRRCSERCRYSSWQLRLG